MSNISRKIQADKGMTGGVSHFKAADWSKGFVCKFIFSLTSYSVFHLLVALVEGYKTVYLCHLDSYTVTMCTGYLVSSHV